MDRRVASPEGDNETICLEFGHRVDSYGNSEQLTRWRVASYSGMWDECYEIPEDPEVFGYYRSLGHTCDYVPEPEPEEEPQQNEKAFWQEEEEEFSDFSF